jgi:agmatine deiminase
MSRVRWSVGASSGLWCGLVCGLAVGLPAAGQVKDPVAGPGPKSVKAGAASSAEPLPRYLTDAEREWMRNNPPVEPAAETPPPQGPLWCPGEYGPMDGILISWSQQGNWPSTWRSILNQMVAQITTVGEAKVYVAYELDGDVAAATAAFDALGADLSKVQFVKANLDSIWIRDYGPRYAYEGKTRVIVDHVYNRPRPNDDAFPGVFKLYKDHTFYGLPLTHGGGNYHIADTGDSFCTRLINNENNGNGDLYNYTEEQIHALWMDYQGVDTTFFDPYPSNVDATQHIDMWMQVFADTGAIISDWPLNEGSAQDLICEGAVSELEGRGWTVHRIPAFSISGVHYTYTNVVMCNDLVLVPTYTQATVEPYNEAALEAWRQACPDKTVVGINCQAIISAAGAMHCIVMHVPAHLGGVSPTVYQTYPHGGEQFQAHDFIIQTWNSDDDEGTVSADIYFSTDGGKTYPSLLAGNIADTQAYYWSIPDVKTAHARLKVVLRDGDGNEGSAESGDFTIGDPCDADLNGDETLDLFDFLEFNNLFNQGDPFADWDQNGEFDLFDFLGFVNSFNAGC